MLLEHYILTQMFSFVNAHNCFCPFISRHCLRIVNACPRCEVLFQFKKREFIPQVSFILEVNPRKLFLDRVPSSSWDNVRMRIALTFSCIAIMRVTGLTITSPFGISKTGSDLEVGD